jgi:hypothetical protein
VEVRIGLVNTSRELTLETSQSAQDVEALVTEALNASTSMLKLSDEKGKTYLVATANLAYVELGSDQSRRVGFVG